MTDEHFVVAECLVLSLLAVLEVYLLQYVVVSHVDEVPLCFRPYLRPVAAAGKLDPHKLGVIVRPRVVHDNQELGRLAILSHRAVEHGIVLAPRAPLQPTRSIEAFLILQ